MGGDNHYLLGKLAALEICNHVCTGDIGENFGGEYKMHEDGAAAAEPLNQVCIFAADGACRYLSIARINDSSGMGQPKISAADGAEQRTDRTHCGCSVSSGYSLPDDLHVGLMGKAGIRELSIESLIEEDNLALDSFWRKPLQVTQPLYTISSCAVIPWRGVGTEPPSAVTNIF